MNVMQLNQIFIRDMNIEIRRIGNLLMEVTVKSLGATLVEDVTDLHGYVDEEFIESLRDVADELELSNEQLTKSTL